MGMGNISQNFQKWWRYELSKSLFDRLFFDNSRSQIEHSNAIALWSLQGRSWIFIYSVGQIKGLEGLYIEGNK